MSSSAAARRGAALAFVALIGLVACAGAPVQEMSDARQAIAAARSAGGAERAPEQFKLATSLLAQAEAALEKHDYKAARRQAQQARTKAMQALRASSSERRQADDG